MPSARPCPRRTVHPPAALATDHGGRGLRRPDREPDRAGRRGRGRPHAGGVRARHVGDPLPPRHRITRPGRRDERPDGPRDGPGDRADPRRRRCLAGLETTLRWRALPRGRVRGQPPAPGRHEALVRAPPAEAPVGPGAARLQLPERPHDERDHRVRRACPDRLVGVRSKDRRRRAGRRDRARVRGRPEPHLPRLPLPHRRRRRSPRRYRLAAGSGRRLQRSSGMVALGRRQLSADRPATSQPRPRTEEPP